MRPSEDLFGLVKSMSPNEMRFFRLQATQSSSKKVPVYLRLYDVLVGMDRYNEKVVKNAFAGEPCLRQFTRIKNYLFEKLLSSLRQFHAENSVQRQCLSALDAVELLFSRQLFQQARLQHRKAERIALGYHLTEHLPAILAWERKLIKQKGGPKAAELLAELEIRERRAHHRLELERQLSALYDQLLFLSKTRREHAPANDPDLPGLLSHPALSAPPENLSFTAGVAHHLCRALGHRLAGRMQDSHEHYRRALQCWEAERDMCTAFPDRYLRAAAAFLYSCHGIGDYAEFDPLLARIRDDAEMPGVQRSSILVMSYNLRLLYYLNRGPLSGAGPIVTALRAELGSGAAPLSTRISAHLNLATYFFLMEAFRDCYHHLCAVIDQPRGQEVSDLRELARSLVLIIHLEMDREDLLPYALRSMLRFVRHRRPLNDLETALREFFMQIDRDPGPRNRKAALRELGEGLEGKEAPGLREVQLWVRSRLEGRSMASLHSAVEGSHA